MKSIYINGRLEDEVSVSELSAKIENILSKYESYTFSVSIDGFQSKEEAEEFALNFPKSYAFKVISVNSGMEDAHYSVGANFKLNNELRASGKESEVKASKAGRRKFNKFIEIAVENGILRNAQ